MTAGFKTVLLKARHAEQHGDGAEARRLLRAALREYPGNRKAKAELDRLSAETDDAPAALRKEAFAQGVDPDRLVFAAKMDRADHLARHVHADLFPDTCVENPHATANGAVRAGLSKLTLAGSQFAARVATSVPPAIDLPEPSRPTRQIMRRRRWTLPASPRNWRRTGSLRRCSTRSPTYRGGIRCRAPQAAGRRGHITIKRGQAA